MHWLYVAVVRPAKTFGSIVWWTKLEAGVGMQKMVGVQRLAVYMSLGASATVRVPVWSVSFNLLTIVNHIMMVARLGACRLQFENLWVLNGEPHQDHQGGSE